LTFANGRSVCPTGTFVSLDGMGREQPFTVTLSRTRPTRLIVAVRIETLSN
jgi:hypothetical protein